MVENPDNRGDGADRERGRVPPVTPTVPPVQPMMSVLERNIRALDEQRRREEAKSGWQERIAQRVTDFTGSMVFVYIHLLLFGTWIAVNVGLVPGVPRFDPSLVILAMAASVEAIFLSTFVLISQNRSAALAERRAELDLQVNLLSEHEITKLMGVATAIAERLGVETWRDPEIAEAKRDIAPELVIQEIDAQSNGERKPPPWAPGGGD